MNGLRLRDARPGDRDAIAAVTLAAYQQYAAPMADYWEGYRQNILATLAAVSPARQLVAEIDGAVVGSMLLYPPGAVIATAAEGSAVTSDAPEVRLLAVAPEARGRGVGEALMREGMRRARESGASAIVLHSAPMMEAAMRMYRRLGFRHAPELDFQPVPGATVEGYRLVLDAGGADPA